MLRPPSSRPWRAAGDVELRCNEYGAVVRRDAERHPGVLFGLSKEILRRECLQDATAHSKPVPAIVGHGGARELRVGIILERVFGSGIYARSCNHMIATRICKECEQCLRQAATAIRFHETDLHKGLQLNEQGLLTEEFRREFAPVVVTSFNKAQAAWDAYREHLIGHGLLERGASAANPPA